MRIVGRDILHDFCRAHADARGWIANWIADVEAAMWRTPQDVKRGYSSASILAGNVVIFNVRGNHYRLETRIAFNTGVVVIRSVPTHAEYSKRST